MKKKSLGIILASIIGALVVVVAIPHASVKPVTESANQDLTNTTSTNYNLPNFNSVNYGKVTHNSSSYLISDLNSLNLTHTKKWLKAIENVEGRDETIYVSIDDYLFNVTYYVDAQNFVVGRTVSLNPQFNDFYHEVGYFDKPADAVVVYPLFTQAAYEQNGFYDYYNKKCDSNCLTLDIPTDVVPVYQTSRNSYNILKLLHYDTITDVDVDKNPSILDKYKKVIILHNEYVTQREFDAITHHPNVVYLYPNALYAKIKTDYDKNTLTLIKGHGYPDSTIGNGFDWKFDNSKFEYNLKCDGWQFRIIDNGKMLDCYPTFILLLDKDVLREISQ